MDWLNNWNKALDYLEEHLEGETDPGEFWRLAGCSAHHFQRMLSYLAGVPLSEYIRRRRMTLAAAELQSGEKVLAVALRYGYDSPTAFNRAFQAVHGVPPSQAKRGAKLKAYPRIRFKFILKGTEEMEYQIVQKEAFRIVGFRTPISTDLDESFQAVPKFWVETGPHLAELFPLMNGEPVGILCACSNSKEENYYYIAVASSAPVPEGMYEWTIPAASWAVFSGNGPLPGAMQDLQRRIITEYLPDSGYELDKAPDIEVYLDQPGEESRFQVWLPVTKP